MSNKKLTLDKDRLVRLQGDQGYADLSMKLFKSKLWLFAVLVFALFSSCDKDKVSMPIDRQASKTETYEIVQDVLLEALEDPTVRSFIKTEALKTVTYDYEVIYGMVKDQAMDNGVTLESAFLKAEAALLERGVINASVVTNLQTVAPLLSINVPIHISGWNTDDFLPAVVLDPEGQKVNGFVVAEYHDGRTDLIYRNNLPDYPIITLADNERMLYDKGEYRLDYGLMMYIAPKGGAMGGDKLVVPDCLIINGEPICDWPDGPFGPVGPGPGPGPGTGPDTDCESPYNVEVVMTRLRVDNLGSIEFFGRPELRLRVIGGNGVYAPANDAGQVILNYASNPRRSWVNNTWWNISDYMFQWESNYGEIVYFDWKEEDGGAFRSDQDEFNFRFNSTEVTFTIPTFLKERDEDLGDYPVNLKSCNRTFGASGGLRFRVSF